MGSCINSRADGYLLGNGLCSRNNRTILRREQMKKYRITSSKILIEWDNSPKMYVVEHEMPSDLQQAYDEWLNSIEDEANAT